MGSGSSKKGKPQSSSNNSADNVKTYKQEESSQAVVIDARKPSQSYKQEESSQALVIDARKPSQSGNTSKGQNTMSWRHILDQVANLELWEGQNREKRDQWRQYLKKAEEIVRKPRKSIPPDVVRAILEGDMASVDISRIPNAQPKVIVFVSSTFTDTKAERNHLMKDVYPYLRTLCRRLGMDFGTVDMRWGVTEEATMDHSTVDMCVNEIQRCIKDSAGPAFVCFLCHKYGYRPLPAQIDQLEYNTLLDHLNKSETDTSLLTSYYRLDTNAVPPEYVLKPNSKENKNWWDEVDTIQGQMRKACVACFGENDSRCDKYHISVTETEIHSGVFNNPKSKEQASFIKRNLKDYLTDTHRDRKILDMVGSNVDDYAQEKLEELKEKKLPRSVSENMILGTSYENPSVDACCEYIRHVCDHVCKTLTEGVLESYEARLHVEEDLEFQETMQHRNLAVEKAGLFVGRETETKRITSYVLSQDKKPLVVHGVSGCGKTSIMAFAATQINSVVKNANVILRFLGTTGQSGSARSLMLSVCTQITRIYSKDVSAVPTSYKDLIKYFRTCMMFAPPNKPLVLILDSLDQLSHEDFGQNLAWLTLAEELPANVKLILSSLPTQCLDILKAHLPETNFVEVLQLNLHEGPEIMTKMLEMQRRTVTDQQRSIILKAFTKCPLPLFLRLVVDIAVRWHSYDDVNSDDIADDMSGMITMLFERLESRYGELFVRHALSYITAAKYGLSLAELEDLLSCDDKVLDSIFKWWVPPVRRMPPLLWTRVRNELGIYLAERGTDGVNAYGWYHRQFWETAEKRYLHTPFGDDVAAFKRKAHEAIADYFDGKWENGKPYTPKSSSKPKLEDRKIPKQPIILSGDRKSTRQLNKRKLSELPYHIIQLQDWERFKKLALNLEYIEAKFEAGFGYNCLSEFIEATKLSEIDDIKQMTRFIGSDIGFLIREPSGIYQMALQQSKKNIARKLLESMNISELPLPLMVNKREEDIDDPCEMTLQGHTETIRSCHYSPRGDLIVSTADDGSMRIWDTTTGAELVTITSLPPPVWPDQSESIQLMLHPVNPCGFSRKGEFIANGTEAGGVMLWNASGVQLKAIDTQNKKAVSSIQFSPDDKIIATSFKNSVISFWSATDLSHVSTIDVGWEELTGVDYSPDGASIAVMCIRGLVMVDTSTYTIRSRNRGYSSLSLCCKFHPSGRQIMSGGDDSMVTVWDSASGAAQTQATGHTAWIWSICFTKDGKYMFTGSSDRSMKVWTQSKGNWSVMTTVGGHSHRVSMVSIQPGSESKMVTSSLDRSLKVWDTQSLKDGKVPSVGGGGHYTTCIASPSGKYIATSQGWHKQCNVFLAQGEKLLGKTEIHKGFIKMAMFTQDEKRLILLDHGHAGDYSRGVEKHARVRVISLPEVEKIVDITVTEPTSIAVSSKYIVVGTFPGNVYLFDLNSYEVLNTWSTGVAHQDGDSVIISRVAISSVNNIIATCCAETCKLWDASDSHCTHIKDLVHDSHIQYCTMTSDAQYLVVGAGSGKLYVWNTSDKNVPLFKLLARHTSYIKDIQFSNSGQYMVTAAGLSMRVWNIKDKFNLVCTYYAPVNCASFLEEKLVLAGEATGILKYLSF